MGGRKMAQFAVIGLGRFGASVARALVELGQQVLVIDINEELVQDASEFATDAVCIDATDEKALRSVGITDVDVAIVSIGTRLDASILVTLALKEIGVKEIIAKGITPTQVKVLDRIGATRIVSPEVDMGTKLAHSLIMPDVIEQINLSPEYSLFETKAPEEFLGKTLEQLKLRVKYNVNVIAIKNKSTVTAKNGVEKIEEKLNVTPKAEDKVQAGDSLIMVGPRSAIKKLKKD